jgi:hypothetical protein
MRREQKMRERRKGNEGLRKGNRRREEENRKGLEYRTKEEKSII